ncbi:MAG: adenylosuccinate lyase [Lachnospiraceae bacterium]|uniref:adenylosuccinate lyase n=1 Tax=Candidatus Merdisoma sp. JLR.KK011 TaxID=3114299 RepID=UPI001433E9F3|nr:adenylosuccinate lyase [Lachnospiraceae bacterium]MCI9478375.1 adenylosuccinate lyase [Lachnospiraceae bacterium]MCI9624701.1 adenylosuccinate lyase [Lachnospiraceae bacterium]GFI09827.1 adenylosuccinate lyase [Lachnospiraceae bacterium]
MSTDRYVSPLSERYASKEMQYIFSPDKKFRTWRRLWIALAETEKELGLNITQEQIDELKVHQDDINYDVAKAREKEVRHDVMSHVYAYGQQCPKAKGIIHLGATSCYVGDNTDIIVMTEALKLVRKKLVNVIGELARFADEYKALPTLAFTHFQPAQPTTVGKRAALWMQEFCLDLEDLNHVISTMKLLGSKGTTGTQASFLELFDGDQETIDKIDPMIAKKMGFEECYPVSGQTYSRKVDTRVLNVLAGIAASAHKMSNDIRLLQHLKEVEEPFEKSQIGSSAMAYKRNPMRSERIASLSRYVMVDALNPAITSAAQWFERTLDDSANKRLSVPEGFLAVDGILDLCLNVVDGLVVYPKVIEKRLMSELPFMATENIMMDAVKAGGDRQELHERIRELSMEAGKNVKVNGGENNLLELIAADPSFNLSLEDLRKTMEPSRYVGRAREQVEAFLGQVVKPILEEYKELLGVKAEINV